MPNKISVKLSEPINLAPDGSIGRKWLVSCTEHAWCEVAAVPALSGYPDSGVAPGFWAFENAWNYAEQHVKEYHPHPLSNRGRVLHPEDDDRDHRNVNYPETWRF